MIIVMVATPRSAQTMKMDRPAGVFGEKSPKNGYVLMYVRVEGKWDAIIP
jgi:hypothetical protein